MHIIVFGVSSGCDNMVSSKLVLGTWWYHSALCHYIAT